MRQGEDAISVKNLSKTFGGGWSLFGGRNHEIKAVKDVTLALKHGELHLELLAEFLVLVRI